MRTARIQGEGNSFYPVMSRVVDGQFIFGDLEKEVSQRYRHLLVQPAPPTTGSVDG